jgi:serine/threonine-protein kinase
LDRRVGTILNGKWTIERLIGRGGMAVVYAARHRNKKRAAIKMLLPELSADPVIRERFLREGYVANSVEHAGAVRVDDDDVSEDGAAYLVMELLEGETVQSYWERAGSRLPLPAALALADQLLSTLIVAHAAGVVHRDVKPDNLYLTRNGTLKILDFGIARLREVGQSSRATRTGSVMGTPAFMAPEQARGRWELVDARTDLWAVGAVLFALITGRPVHQAETANETLALACIQRATPIRSLDPNVPAPVAELIDRALSYVSDERFSDATSMQQALRDAVHAVYGEQPLPSLATLSSSIPPAAHQSANLDSGSTSAPGQSNAHGSGAHGSGAHASGPENAATVAAPSIATAAVPQRSAPQPEAARAPTQLTAALSNNFAPALRPRPRPLLLGAVALAVGLLAVSLWAVSRKPMHEVTATVSSQSPPRVVQLGSLASTGALNDGSGEQSSAAASSQPAVDDKTTTPRTAPSASAAASASSSSKPSRLAGPPQRKSGAHPAAAKTIDPMSMRR